MTPEELARKHPRLYHLTNPDCLEGIKRFGLQSTTTILTRFGLTGARRWSLEFDRRPSSVRLADPLNGVAMLNDNKPLSKTALAKCLDDGLSPEDWLAMLNKRVFFWSNKKGLSALAGAHENVGKRKLLISLDTFLVAKEYGHLIEMSPINSGATLRKAARRGKSTFCPMQAHSFDDWRKLRGKKDSIKEVTVLEKVENLDQFDVHYEFVG